MVGNNDAFREHLPRDKPVRRRLQFPDESGVGNRFHLEPPIARDEIVADFVAVFSLRLGDDFRFTDILRRPLRFLGEGRVHRPDKARVLHREIALDQPGTEIDLKIQVAPLDENIVPFVLAARDVHPGAPHCPGVDFAGTEGGAASGGFR